MGNEILARHGQEQLFQLCMHAKIQRQMRHRLQQWSYGLFERARVCSTDCNPDEDAEAERVAATIL